MHARARARAGIARPGAGAILVVDDDPMCCRLMVAALEFDGHRVDWTTVPAQALDLVRKKHYSVVVSDVNMPSMLGTALAAEVGRLCPTARMILVSAFADGQVHAAARALGSALLAKPFQVDALTAAVRDLLRDPDEQRAVP